MVKIFSRTLLLLSFTIIAPNAFSQLIMNNGPVKIDRSHPIIPEYDFRYDVMDNLISPVQLQILPDVLDSTYSWQWKSD